jgi:hypothetical protein
MIHYRQAVHQFQPRRGQDAVEQRNLEPSAQAARRGQQRAARPGGKPILVSARVNVADTPTRPPGPLRRRRYSRAGSGALHDGDDDGVHPMQVTHDAVQGLCQVVDADDQCVYVVGMGRADRLSQHVAMARFNELPRSP